MSRWNGAVLIGSFAAVSSLILGVAATTGFSQVDSSEFNLLGKVTEVRKYVESGSFDSSTCSSFLKELLEQMASLEPAKMNQEALLRDAPSVIETMFKTRMAIHEKIPSLSPECLQLVRNLNFEYRMVEEMLAEKRYNVQHLKPEQVDFKNGPRPIKDVSKFPYFHFAPGFEGSGTLRLQNGDIMGTRGISLLSATIGSILDAPGVFSHVVLVHVDKMTGVTEALEALDYSGGRNFDIDYSMKNENIRLLVVRPKDAEVGSRAADLAYTMLTTAVRKGKPIPYDYALDFSDRSRVSCAEIARIAYNDASNGTFILPEHPSRLQISDQALMKGLGMRNGETFAPSDLEMDSRFNIVGEYRDLRLTRDSRQKQMVMKKVFEWIEKQSYKFGTTATARLAKNVALPIRKTPLWPLFQKLTGVSNFAKDVPRKLIGTMAVVTEIGDALVKEIREQDDLHLRNTGWPMTMKQMGEVLERVREEDYKAYLASLAEHHHNPIRHDDKPKPKFHKNFHPQSAER